MAQASADQVAPLTREQNPATIMAPSVAVVIPVVPVVPEALIRPLMATSRPP